MIKRTLLIMMLFVLAVSFLMADKDCNSQELTAVGGKTFTLNDFKGKKLFLLFWATWCPWCRKEIPQLKTFYEKHKEKIVIVALSLDKDKEKLHEYLKENELPFVVAYGSKEYADCFGGIRGIPTLFVLDENLNLQKKFVGYTPVERLEQELNY